MSEVRPQGFRILINYRREDSSGHAGRLFEDLAAHFGEENVFIDIDAIEPGVDFTRVIAREVDSCDVFLAVIGRHWASVANAAGVRRIEDPGDFVRLEIRTALEREDLRLIPLLVQGAQMPAMADLPEDLAMLAYRNAMELSDARWRYDVGRLIQALDRIREARRPPPSPPPPPVPPSSASAPAPVEPAPTPVPSPAPAEPAPAAAAHGPSPRGRPRRGLLIGAVAGAAVVGTGLLAWAMLGGRDAAVGEFVPRTGRATVTITEEDEVAAIARVPGVRLGQEAGPYGARFTAELLAEDSSYAPDVIHLEYTDETEQHFLTLDLPALAGTHRSIGDRIGVEVYVDPGDHLWANDAAECAIEVIPEADGVSGTFTCSGLTDRDALTVTITGSFRASET